MRYRVMIDTSNAAFDEPGDADGQEVARILRDLASRIERSGDLFPELLRDVNGNTVGYACHGNPGEIWNWGSRPPSVVAGMIQEDRAR